MYLITVKYRSDSERKRIEYILDKWKQRMNITKPDGMVAIVGGDDIEELITDLYSRTDSENVTLYRIEETQLDVNEEEKTLRVTLHEKKETLEKLISFIMARQRAVLKLQHSEPYERVYEVITKRGKVQIAVRLREKDAGLDLQLRTSGYGEAVDLLHNRLAEELRLLEG